MNRYIFLIFAVFTIFLSCDKEKNGSNVDCGTTAESTSINKILPLGASRVEGGRPDYESYRYELWKRLVDGGWTFDFIGSNCDDGSYAVYAGNSFDNNHEGRGGYTSGQILAGIDEWLVASGSPDVVLFSSPGGNDALQSLSYTDAIDNINAIIDKLQANNPNVTIIIEKLAPATTASMTTELTTFFNQMQQDVNDIATNQTTTTSSVIVVDMATGFNDSYLADDVHYNEEGAAFIADRYYTLLDTILER
ncbi:MAG: GDSL-type esterase/lipase family protein [Saprospiraceae bacterium]|nr:GDSL-type esterase/lipase family protein [Saprospiraceae bacterium]